MFQVPVHRARRAAVPHTRLVGDLFDSPAATAGGTGDLQSSMSDSQRLAGDVGDLADATGAAIGRDYARFGLAPPVEHLSAGHPVRRGWQDGVARFRHRSRPARLHVHEWLSLRLDAWLRGIAFDELHVTPHYLRQIHPDVCPVTRRALTHGHGRDTDAVVVRLRADVGYELGNLAVVSSSAARLLLRLQSGLCSWLASHDPQVPFGSDDDLAPEERSRLLVLATLATPLPHAAVRDLPLLVLPPNRLHVVNGVQGLQAVLTMTVVQPAFGRRVADLASRISSAAGRRAFHAFMHTLLARRVEGRLQHADGNSRHGLEDAWRHPLVVQRWRQFAAAIDEATVKGLVDAGARDAQGRGASSGQGYSR